MPALAASPVARRRSRRRLVTLPGRRNADSQADLGGFRNESGSSSSGRLGLVRGAPARAGVQQRGPVGELSRRRRPRRRPQGRPDRRRRGVPLRGSDADAGQAALRAARFRVRRAVLDRRRDRGDRPGRADEHSGPRSARGRRPDGDRHPVPRTSRRADEARRRLRRVGAADRGVAHRDPRLLVPAQPGQPVRALELSQRILARRIRPAGARRHLDQPSRPSRTGEHAGRGRAGRGGPSHPARRRRRLGPHRRLRTQGTWATTRTSCFSAPFSPA